MSRRLLPLLLVCAFPLAALAQPRPVGEAERAAVALVAHYLARGPVALHAALTPDAPVRALPPADALAELSARTGPVKGSTWRLQTADSGNDVAVHVTFASGYDDALLLRMKESDRGWLLHEVRTIAEPLAMPPRPAPMVASYTMIAVIGLVALLALVAIRGRARFIIGTATASLFLVALASRLIPQPPALPFIELRDAAPVREALARGDDPRIPRTLSNEARSIALLWVLQSGRAATIAGTAADPFAGLGLMSATPLGQLVRGRIAAGQARRDTAASAFQKAASLAPQRDDLLAEAASATSEEAYLERLRRLGSREAEAYYAAARREVGAGRVAGAAEAFHTAWNLQPLTREELVRDASLFPLLRDESIRQLVSFFAPHEPLVAARDAGSRPLALPPNAKPFVLGSLLRVTIGEATLDVPGGASLAPLSARVVPATHWQREREAADLRDAERLLEHPAAIAASSPHRLLRAADALARRKRWSDVLALTNGTDSSPLLVARIDALVRLGRHDDARAAVNGAGVRGLRESKRDPIALIAIADAMARASQHDLAASLYSVVRGTAWESLADERRKQLEARRVLIAAGITTSTEHFDIRHSLPQYEARAIGYALEGELAKLRRQLPAPSFRRVAVNILGDGEFRAATGADHIRGQYDGEIFLPLAHAASASTISHELTHALVAQLTNDNAPRWFQEGLAERMEATPPPKPERFLPIALLDALLDNPADRDLTRDGYHTAHAFVRFLEQRYGAGVIVALIEDFRSGKTSDEALIDATGRSASALDADFRASMHELAAVANVVREDVLAEAIR